MGDRPGSSSRVRMSEDKVRRKDWCWSVRTVLILRELSDVSGPGLEEAGRYKWYQSRPLRFHGLVCQLRKHGAHDWCGPGVVTQHGTCAGTGHTDVAKRGRS